MFLLGNDTLYINNNPQNWDLQGQKKRADHVEHIALGVEPLHEQYSTDDEVMCQQTPDGC